MFFLFISLCVPLGATVKSIIIYTITYIVYAIYKVYTIPIYDNIVQWLLWRMREHLDLLTISLELISVAAFYRQVRA